MTTGWIISGSRFAPFLMGRVWFNCEWFLSGVGLFSQIRDGFETNSGIITYVPPCPDYILKIFFYYFILHFNIINNNN